MDDPYGAPICQAATNSYAACYGNYGPIGELPDDGSGLFFRNSHIRIADIQDGTSQLRASKLKKAELASPEPCDGSAGCDVHVTEVCGRIEYVRSPECVEAITLRLAPYLIANPGIKVAGCPPILDSLPGPARLPSVRWPPEG